MIINILELHENDHTSMILFNIYIYIYNMQHGSQSLRHTLENALFDEITQLIVVLVGTYSLVSAYAHE